MACADDLPTSVVSVVCSQLGYDPNYTLSTAVDSASVSVVRNERPYSFILTSSRIIGCNGNETNLTSCFINTPVDPSQPPDEFRRKRITDENEVIPSCNSLAQVQCGGEPFSYSCCYDNVM